MKFGSLKRFAAAFLALTLVLTFAPPRPAAGESAITVQDPSAVPLEADPAIKQVTVQNAAIVAGKTYLLFLVPAGTVVPETAPERSAAILGNLLAVKQEVATAGTVTFGQVRAKTAVPVDAYLSGEGFAVPHQLTVAESGELLGSGSISGTATAAHLQDFSASTVTLIDGETGYRYGETTKLLSADGKFDFTAIAPGNYGVEVNAPGYVPVRSVFVQPLKNGETYTLAAVDLNPGTGDVNNDDVFSSQDVKTLSSYLANPEKPAEGNYPDVNGDTKIDTADLAVVISRLKPTAGTIAPTVSVTGSAATATVNKLTVSMNGDVAATEKKPAVTAPKVDAAAFTIGYDAAVIVPCKPDGTAIESPADSFAAALGMTAYDAAQTPGTATDPATVSLKTYGNGTQGDAVAEFYYTYASGKSDADCNNTTFQLRSAYGSFGDAAFAKYGAGESTLKKQGFTYPNSTVQVLGTFRLEGPDTIAVPTNGTADLQVKLVAMDTLGNPMQDMKLTRSITYPSGSSTGWTERSAGTGFAFTLGQTVQSGTLKLVVTDQKTNRTAEKSVTVAKALPVAKNVFIGGGDSTITTEEGETASRSYSATVVDQYGEAMPGANVTWGGTPPSNCTRSGETVTVGATVRPGTYYFNLTATSGGAHDSIRVTIKVTSKVVPPPKPTPTQPPKPNPGGGGGAVVPPVPEVDADVPAETLKESPAITVTPKAVAGAGGVYTATLTPDELAAINLAMTGSRGAVVIAPQVGADATGVAVTLPKTAVSALSARGGRGMELRSSLGTISLNCGALTAAAAAAGENLTVSTSAVGGDKSILKVEMMAGDNSLQSLAGGVTLTAPVPAALGTTGLVAVLVAADGTETVVRKSAAVNGNMVVPLSGGATVKLKSVPSPFTDMDGHWAADSAAFTSVRGLFTGITPATFVPGDDMTRGMVVTVLHRLEDLPHAGQPAVFQDVASDAWYTDAVSWAADSGIVQGSGSGFLPGDNVSREQLATMLYRYAKQQKLSVAGQKNLAKFPDGTDVSSWSQDAMSWAVAAGLFAGGSDGRLNPGGTASRAEVAIILERFVTFAAKER